MTEKWGQIQKKQDLVGVNGGVRVIRVWVTGVLLKLSFALWYEGIYMNKFIIIIIIILIKIFFHFWLRFICTCSYSSLELP